MRASLCSHLPVCATFCSGSRAFLFLQIALRVLSCFLLATCSRVSCSSRALAHLSLHVLWTCALVFCSRALLCIYCCTSCRAGVSSILLCPSFCASCCCCGIRPTHLSEELAGKTIGWPPSFGVTQSMQLWCDREHAACEQRWVFCDGQCFRECRNTCRVGPPTPPLAKRTHPCHTGLQIHHGKVELMGPHS